MRYAPEFPEFILAEIRPAIAEKYEILEERVSGIRAVFWIADPGLIALPFAERNRFAAQLSQRFGNAPYRLGTEFYHTRSNSF